MVPDHVPAWRKLGLKLKYAKDLAETTQSSAPVPFSADSLSSDTRKRSLAAPENSPYGGTRKPKRLTVVEYRSSLGSMEDCDATEKHLYVEKSSKQMNRWNSKSVSFMSDTQPQEDKWRGEDIAQNSGGCGGSTEHLKLLDLPQVDTDSTRALSYTAKVSKLAKNEKKTFDSSLNSQLPNGRLEPERSSDTEDIPQHLLYLDRYYHSRSAWKFNKARQNYVLKHAFDLREIPPSYDESLYHYVMGLQGQKAMERLNLEARDAIDADEQQFEQNTERNRAEPKNEPERSQLDAASVTYMRTRYEEALTRVKKQIRMAEIAREEGELVEDSDWRERFFRRRRAEILYWVTEQEKLDTMIPHPRPGKIVYEDEAGSRGTEADDMTIKSAFTAERSGTVGGVGIAIKCRRLRKRRTGVPDDDTSSEETSSSSDTSGNSGDGDTDELHALDVNLVRSLGDERPVSASNPNKATTQIKGRRKRKKRKVVVKSSISSESTSDSNTSSCSSEN